MGHRGGAGSDEGRETRRGEAHHRVADLEAGDVGPYRNHVARALHAERRPGKAVLDRLVRQDSHGVHDIPEIEAGRAHPDFDLPPSRRAPGAFVPEQIRQRSRRCEVQPQRPARTGHAAWLRRALGACGAQALQPRGVAGLRRNQDLVLGIGVGAALSRSSARRSAHPRREHRRSSCGAPGARSRAPGRSRRAHSARESVEGAARRRRSATPRS